MSALTTKAELHHTARSAGTIGIITSLASLVGFGLQLLMAYYFGASSKTDAYFMAQSTSEMLSKLLLGGSITAVFIPLFIERITARKMNEAWDLALNLLHITGISMLVLIVALGVFAEPFIHFVAPGFDEATTLLTVHLLQIMLPSFFFMFIVTIFTAMLNSLHQFTVPAVLRAVAPASSIIAILLSVRWLGIYSLALGALVGSIIQVAIIVWALAREGFRYRWIFSLGDPAMKRLATLVSPFIFSVLVTQAAGIVYRILVSGLPEGSLTALKYGEKITTLLSTIFLQSVIMVIYPLLAAKASRKDFSGMQETLGTAIRLVTFISVPLMVLVIFLREPLVALLYQRGSFTFEDTTQTSIALLYLIIGLTTNAVSALLGYTVLALQETKMAVAVTVVSQVVAIVLFALLTPQIGLAGLALASSLVPLSSSALYLWYLRRFLPDVRQLFYHASLAKTFGLGIVLAAVMAGLTRIILPSSSLFITSFVQAFLWGGLGAGVYMALAYAWNIAEVHEIVTIFGEKASNLRRKLSPL